MKILYPDLNGNLDKPGDGGTSDTIWNMANSLIEQGHTAMIIAPYTTNLYPFPVVPVFSYSSPHWFRQNIFGNFLSFVHLARVINKNLPDFEIIHTRDYLSAIFIALLCKKPVVITVAGNPLERKVKKLPYFDPVTSFVFEWASRIVVRIPSCFIVVTSLDMQTWWKVTGAHIDRMVKIPLGVNTKLFSRRENSKEKLNWNPKSFHLLYVGRLISKLKGLEELLLAISYLKDNVDLHLHIVGTGASERYLRNYAIDLKINEIVSFHGWATQDHLPDYYSAADLCVLPSRSEGFGRTMLESMSCRTPFFGTVVGGIADYIVDGETGFYLKEVSAELLADRLLDLVNNPLLVRKVAEAGYRYVINNLAWEQVMQELIEKVYLPIAKE